jgi:hypothetical protein
MEDNVDNTVIFSLEEWEQYEAVGGRETTAVYQVDQNYVRNPTLREPRAKKKKKKEKKKEKKGRK